MAIAIKQGITTVPVTKASTDTSNKGIVTHTVPRSTQKLTTDKSGVTSQ